MYSRSMLQASIRHSGTYVPLHNTHDFTHFCPKASHKNVGVQRCTTTLYVATFNFGVIRYMPLNNVGSLQYVTGVSMANRLWVYTSVSRWMSYCQSHSYSVVYCEFFFIFLNECNILVISPEIITWLFGYTTNNSSMGHGLAHTQPAEATTTSCVPTPHVVHSMQSWSCFKNGLCFFSSYNLLAGICSIFYYEL